MTRRVLGRTLSFLEDIGSLLEKKYVEAGDIFNFMGGVINMAAELLEAHIIWLRHHHDDDLALYANALKVMESASSFNYTTYDLEVRGPGSRSTRADGARCLIPSPSVV